MFRSSVLHLDCLFGVEWCEFFMYFSVLSELLFANNFSHSGGCPLVLLMVSFTVQKILVGCGLTCLFHYYFLLLLGSAFCISFGRSSSMVSMGLFWREGEQDAL